MKISGNGKNIVLTVNKKRCGIFISKGPWLNGIDPNMIKIYPKKWRFPEEMINHLKIENNSDPITDYYESDCLRLFPGNPLYDMAKAAIQDTKRS